MTARLISVGTQFSAGLTGVLLGYLLISVVAEPEPQPEPVVVVCTWAHGCQETSS